MVVVEISAIAWFLSSLKLICQLFQAFHTISQVLITQLCWMGRASFPCGGTGCFEMFADALYS